MMKKIIKIILVVSLTISVLSISAVAADPMFGDYYLLRTDHAYSGLAKKLNSTGTSASITSNPDNNARMYYQVRNNNNDNMSNPIYITGSGTQSASYKKDGYGNSLGRNGYEYKLLVLHSENSTQTDTIVGCTSKP